MATGSHHGAGQAAQRVGDRPFALAHRDEHPGQKADVELGTDGIENRAHQQRAEQPLGHGAEGVNAVAFSGEDNVFSSQKILEFPHEVPFFPLLTVL